LRIERVLGLRVASPIALTDDPLAAPAGTCDVRFHLEPEAPQGPTAVADPLEIRTPDDTPYLQMGLVEGAFLLRFPGWADFVVSRDGRSIACTPAPGIPIGTVRHLLQGQVLPRAMGLLREPALHGSAVGRDDDAIGFLGPTGHGKSTLALSFARAGWTLLGDDCLLLRALEDGVEVLPSRVGARVWPDSAEGLLAECPRLPAVAHYTDKLRVDDGVGGLVLAEKPVRLRGLFLLEPQDDPAAPPATSPLGEREAFEALLLHVMRLSPADPGQLRREFEFLTRLVARVSLRRLRFPQAFEQLSVVRTAVEADLAQPSPRSPSG
jgi:hypothetical protein